MKRISMGSGKHESSVLQVLKRAHKPLSAYDILAAMKGSNIKAPSQVYRTLDKLLEHKLVHRIASLNAYMLCDHPEHDHPSGFLVCRKCGTVTEFDISTAVKPLSIASASSKIDSFNVELEGVCEGCISPVHG